MEAEMTEENEHEHCKACYYSNCTQRPVPAFSCAVLSCDQDCGARFHACKLSEHRKLCSHQRVNCINLDNGCPIVMPRSQLGGHLEICPASVIHCTVEWNRWPLYSSERQSRVPFAHKNVHAEYGQLDVALALRDQRMLDEAMKAPRKIRNVLRNNLTRRFPAVPLQPRSSTFDHEQVSNETSRTISDDESDTPWEIRKNPPGLQRSVCKELLYSASMNAAEKLSAALSVVTENEEESSVKQASQKMSSIADRNSFHSLLGADAAEVEKKESPHPDEAHPSGCQGHKQAGQGQSLVHLNGTNGAQNGLSTQNSHRDSSEDELNNERMSKDDSDSETGSNQLATQLHAVPIPPPMASLKLKEVLGLDLNLESITRYQAKPKSMYTFLCAQEFRRDEYAWHRKNLHLDIHGGLNGWLEHRCPLAHYGCTFSIRRFHPAHKKACVVHSVLSESFGIRPHIDECYRDSTQFLNSNDADSRNCKQTLYTSKDSNSDVLVSCSHDKNLVGLNCCVDGEASKDSNSDVLVSCSHDKNLVGLNCCVNGEASDQCWTSVPEANAQQQQCSQTSEKSSAHFWSTADFFENLPFEILQQIARCLDGFSLCNLALTSRRLREVCCSLLEERGVVVLQWEQYQSGERKRWRVAYKRWFFSTAFTPVDEWIYKEDASMSEHLKTCSFNKRNVQGEPFNLPPWLCRDMHSPNFYESMRRMYPKVDFASSCKNGSLQYYVKVSDEKS